MKARITQFGPGVERRLKPDFLRVGIDYPPAYVTLTAFKRERVLEVYASGPERHFRLVRSYRILGASGTLGPKLKEGDGQVPEGLYQIESLNPESLYHLALRVDYPNHFDRKKAKEEGRDDLGGDIMIHGSTGSIGCLAVGDEAAEDLFVLSALTGLDKINLIFSPVDFRTNSLPDPQGKSPAWTEELYASIRKALQGYQKMANQRREPTAVIPVLESMFDLAAAHTERCSCTQLMKTLFLSILASALATCALSAAPIPPELTGEWVSPKPKFNGEVLARGVAIYLRADGFAAFFAADEGDILGSAGRATYNAAKQILILDMHDRGTPPERLKITVNYDPKAKTLKTIPSADIQKETFTRRQDKIPKWVITETK